MKARKRSDLRQLKPLILGGLRGGGSEVLAGSTVDQSLQAPPTPPLSSPVLLESDSRTAAGLFIAPSSSVCFHFSFLISVPVFIS